MEQFKNPDTELVLFYKNKIELKNNRISNLLILYPIPDQPYPLLTPVSLSVFQSDYEIMINYFRIVEKGLYSIGYRFINPQGVYRQIDNQSNMQGDGEYFAAICNSVKAIYGDLMKQKGLYNFFDGQQLPAIQPCSYVPGYLVDQILLINNTK